MSGPSSDSFEDTRWSLVQKVQEAPASEVRLRALDELCQFYWKPLYWFVRRQGHAEADAADLVQGFFADLVGKEQLGKADRRKGRLRSYLLALLKGYLSDENRRARAQKRGGGAEKVSLDTDEGELLLEKVSGDEMPLIDVGYDKVWAQLLLERALDRLAAEQAEKGKTELFESLRERLLGESDGDSLANIAASLGSSEGTIKVALHRLRKALRGHLRDEVATTLAPGENLEAELRYLATVLAQS